MRALGKCLDVTAASTANGAQIQLYDCNGTTAQRWTYSSATRSGEPGRQQVPGRHRPVQRQRHPPADLGPAPAPPTRSGTPRATAATRPRTPRPPARWPGPRTSTWAGATSSTRPGRSDFS
ncbi:RICIN domain-containing protein [Streptosporangium vulgare]|uniref:RICIN domain-containing protein n=1 Tax=Streptosporangium vulgare TaxID=46190 RepID=UPI0031D335BE